MAIKAKATKAELQNVWAEPIFFWAKAEKYLSIVIAI